MIRRGLLFLGVAGLFVTAPSKGASILVGQCIENATCWTSFSPTPWSDTLTLGQLTTLGLGSTVPFIAAQTAEYVIQLGVTTITFTTGTGSVVDTIPQFTGGFNSDPCNLCEIDTVGSFLIPANATAATISGTFGNTDSPNSGGVNLCVGSGPGPCSLAPSVPEPATSLLLGIPLTGLAGIVTLRRLRAS